MIRWACCGLALLAFALSASAAPPTDVADVFPPGTLAYAELNTPTEVGPQLAALFKGTPLEDSIPFITEKKNAAKSFAELNTKQQLAELALLVSPEVLAEFRKFNGVAIGLTGFNEQGNPEIVVAVLTGDSMAAGMAARAFLTTSTTLREVAKVSKVSIFQHRQPGIKYDPNTGQQMLDNDKKPTEGPHEATFAYTPGLFVAGTSKNALTPVIKRFLGEEKDSLRATAGFKAASTEYRKPGIFLYANAPELIAKLDEAGRKRADPYQSDVLAWLRITANQKAVKWIAGRVQFRDGGIGLALSAKIDTNQTSPLLEFFSGPAVKVETLHHARKPASFAATVNLPEKNRAAALVGFLDSMVKAQGELGRLPSDIVRDLEEKHKLKVRDDLLAKVRSVTVVMPGKQELPKGAKAMPMLVLHMENAAAAAAWEEFLPKLVGEIAGEKPAQPATETIDGVKVLSLAGTGLPWKSPIHYARKDAVIVIGQDRKLVAASVVPDTGASVASNDKPLSLPTGELALVGTVSLGDLIGLIELPNTPGAGLPFDPPPRPRRGDMLPADDLVKEADKARAAFMAAWAELPPAVIVVRGVGDELKLEVFQPKIQGGGLMPVINTGVDWFDKMMNLRNPNTRNPNAGRIYGRW